VSFDFTQVVLPAVSKMRSGCRFGARVPMIRHLVVKKIPRTLKYLFQIASLQPALKGGACRKANRSHGGVNLKSDLDEVRCNQQEFRRQSIHTRNHLSFWRFYKTFLSHTAQPSLQSAER